MAQSWHKKHISTKWGVALLGVLVLGLIVFVTQIGQVQNPFSQAATPKYLDVVYFGKPDYAITSGNKLDIPVYMAVAYTSASRSAASVTIYLPKESTQYITYNFYLDSTFKYNNKFTSGMYKNNQIYMDIPFVTKDGRPMNNTPYQNNKVYRIGILHIEAKNTIKKETKLVFEISSFFSTRPGKATITVGPAPTKKPNPASDPKYRY